MQQRIHINRVETNSIEFELDEIQVPIDQGEEVGFELIIINYGNPTRVNLSAGDNLGDQIAFLKDNPYINEEERVPVIMKMPSGGGVSEGEIFIATAYGSKKRGFKVKMLIGREVRRKIVVDEKLSKKIVEEPKQAHSLKPKIKTHVPHLDVYPRQLTPMEWSLLIPLITLALILISLFLTFGFYEGENPFVGSLFASILIVFFIMYGLKESIDLQRVK